MMTKRDFTSKFAMYIHMRTGGNELMEQIMSSKEFVLGSGNDS